MINSSVPPKCVPKIIRNWHPTVTGASVQTYECIQTTMALGSVLFEVGLLCGKQRNNVAAAIAARG